MSKKNHIFVAEKLKIKRLWAFILIHKANYLKAQ